MNYGYICMRILFVSLGVALLGASGLCAIEGINDFDEMLCEGVSAAGIIMCVMAAGLSIALFVCGIIVAFIKKEYIS